jgi:penicillin amidase
MSANHQPASRIPVPGYYNLRDRAQRLQARLQDPATRWSVRAAQSLQLDVGTGYARRVLAPLLLALRRAADAGPEADKALVEQLASWDGSFTLDSVPATMFSQFAYELARAAVSDEMGESLAPPLLRTRAFEEALPRLAAEADSPWWDRRDTPAPEDRAAIVAQAWSATLAHLRATFGAQAADWTWGRAHTLTHVHPLGRQPPLDRVFNVGPFPVPGTRETPNFMAGAFAPAPWTVGLGPSTRRVIDFAEPAKAQGINPVGQSGVWSDAHYDDQAELFIAGGYRPQHLAEADVAAATRSRLTFKPR